MENMNMFPEGMRVLAVDDDRVCRKLLEKQLQLCKYNVTMVTDGETALEMLRERKDGNQFDLVISDVFMPGMDGFKLLETISLEMDIPVIMLSANDEKDVIMKGINHGACDYLVKPVRMEQITKLWVHVLKKTYARNRITSDNDDGGHKVQSGNDVGEKNGTKRTRKFSRKNKKGHGHAEDKENSSTQKRRRIRWSVPLHQKFLTAIEQIGIEKAVPTKILEKMNEDGLNRDNIASHLQKYRVQMRKFFFRGHYNPYAEPGAWRSDWKPASTAINGMGRCTCNHCLQHEKCTCKHYLEQGSSQPSPPFTGTLNTCNPFARLNSPSALGSGHGLLPIQPDLHMNSHRNLGIHVNGVGPRPVQNVNKCIPTIELLQMLLDVLNDSPLNASNPFPSGTSGSYNANLPNSITSSSFANISTDKTPSLSSSKCFPSYGLDGDYAEVLRRKILGSARGIPFDADDDDSSENMGNGDMLATSSSLPLEFPEFGNHGSIQMHSSSTAPYVAPSSSLPVEFPEFGNHASVQVPSYSPAQSADLRTNFSSSWNGTVLSKFPDLSHNDETSQGTSQPHANKFKINQLSRFVASSTQMTPFGNEFQNQIATLMKKPAPMVGSCDQVVPSKLRSNAGSSEMLNGNSTLGSVSSFRSELPNVQMGNPVVPTQMLNGGVSSGNLHENDDISDQLAVGDQLNNNDESLTSEINDDIFHVLAEFLNEDIDDTDGADSAVMEWCGEFIL